MKNLLFTLLLLPFGLYAQDTQNKEYGESLISVTPLSAYGSEGITDIGVGLNYERFIGKKITLQTISAVGIENNMVQLGIGPKLYPSGHAGRVKYGFSPLFLYTRGQAQTYYFLDSFYPSEGLVRQQFGLMFLNSLDMTVDHDIYVGIEAGLGVNYLNFVEDRDNNNPGSNRTFRMCIGYRF